MVSQEGCDPPVAMAPSPSYLPTAFPKSVNSRATHDGEGAVATANPQMLKWLNAIVNRKSEIAYCVRIGECGIIRARFCN